MKVSTKGRYGTRALLELALHYGEGPVLLKDVSKRQQVSLQYLEHIVNTLVAGGLVKSSRGVKGGVWLARPPAEIKLSEAVRILEGETNPVKCVQHPDECGRSCTCATRDVWNEVKDAIDRVLDSITLAELAERQKTKETDNSEMFYI
jgi:Rrf2 family transcriptional regulator, cysteine metabolism repressor